MQGFDAIGGVRRGAAVVSAWLLLGSCVASPAPIELAARAHVQRQWTVEQGLPSNAVTALAQDRQGSIWVATLAGLAQFDGVRFIVHDAAAHPQLTSDRFTTMKRTPDDALWLSNEQYDLFRYTDGRFERIDGASVLSVTQSPEGWLAYGTTRGILIVGPQGWHWLSSDIAHERVLELDWPGTDTLLALTDSRLIDIAQPLAGATLRRTLAFPGLNSGALMQRADGRVLVGRRDGLYQLDTDWARAAPLLLTDEAVIALDSLDREHVMISTPQRIGELGAQGPVWLSANRDSLGEEPLLVRMDDTVWRVLGDRIESAGEQLRAPSRISDALVDHEGNLWVATNASGLMQFRNSRLRLLGKPEGLAGDNVYPILARPDGGFWIGTLDGGLQHVHGSDTRQWSRMVLPFKAVWALHGSRDGALWVGGDGVCVLIAGICSQQNLPAELQTQTPTRAIHEDPQGRIWVGSIWGLWRRDAEGWRMLSGQEGMRPGRAARAFIDDGAQRLWVATNGDGVLELHDGRLARRIGTEQGLASNAVRSLLRDPVSGDLWAGTENRGLCRIRVDATPMAVRCVDRGHGLPSNGIHAIATDTRGRFWMNSNQGVFFVDRAELTAVLDGDSAQLTRTGLYTARNGLRSSEGNGGVSPALARDSAGRLWFPTQSGIVIIDPADADTDTVIAPVNARVAAVRIGARRIAMPNRVALPADTRSLDVELSADSYLDPEHVRFRYRLLEYDAQWKESGTQRELKLALLPVGEWTLQLQARNTGGEWPLTATSLPVSVLPTWHERSGVRAAALLLIVLSVAALFVWRGSRLRARQHELEALVSARTVDLQQAQRATESALATVREQHAELSRLHRSRTEFAANISHELKTPLTLLTAPLADHPQIASVIGADLLAAMRDSGERMQRLLRQLADLHLIDSAALQLRIETVGLNALVARCVLPFAALAEQRGQSLSTRWQASADATIAVDIFQFEKVIGNLLSNAIKFTPVPGRIRVSTAIEAGQATIRVDDSGEGVPEAYRRAVFERFYQVDGSFRRAHEGSGIGLALAREIVGLHGGSLQCLASELGGAAFVATLPTAVGTDTSIPVTDASAADGVSASVLAPVAAAPAFDVETTERPRILLVEDQAALRTYLRGAFADRYDVVEAVNGHEGLQLAASVLPDVIISDVMMPLMDGVQMTQALRADAATRCIPLVFLTAVDGDHAQIAGLLAGGDHYLTKPFSAQVVRAHVDALLRRRYDLLASLAPTSASAAADPGAGTPTLLSRAEAVIRARLDDSKFDLEALVRALGTSRSQLHRRLQAEHSLSPGELITRTRLNAAAELLAAGHGSVTEVCYSVGFLSLGSFSRAFKARFGCNPSEYAERISQR
jgi:signal transduction histidine kinase/ligand-binding sensor domain-containing protein/DNA-binding response OmpR family regulator